jgi:outer membrane protein TolC
MKSLLLFVCLLIIGQCSVAQGIDYNKIILPSNASDIDNAERLVQLAWKNHPDNAAMQREYEASNYTLKIAKSQWLNIITISGNLNEFNLDPPEVQGGTFNNFYPRYNFGANIPLGIFARVPAEVKRQRQYIKVAEDNVNSQKLKVREAVLQAYNDYLKFGSIYKIRLSAFSNATNSQLLIKEKFKNGDVSMETYMSNESALQTIEINKIEAETDFKNAKIVLEQMIGMKLEEALN